MLRSSLMLAGALLVVPLAASAQPAPAPPAPAPPAPAAAASSAPAPAHARRPNRYAAALRSLDLTPDQRTQIDGFMRDTRAANQGVDRATRRANAKKLRAQIDGVLTPDQRTQLRAALKASAPAAPAQPPAQ